MNKVNKAMENAELFSTVNQNGKRTTFVTRFQLEPPAETTTTTNQATTTSATSPLDTTTTKAGQDKAILVLYNSSPLVIHLEGKSTCFVALCSLTKRIENEILVQQKLVS